MKMKTNDAASPATRPLKYYSSFESSIASVTSAWSDIASQSSDDSSTSISSSDSDSCDSHYARRPPSSALNPAFAPTNIPEDHHQQTQPLNIIPPEKRQNPRRTAGLASRARCPPALVRQCDRKVNFVDSLVDSSTQIVEAIWPLSTPPCRTEPGSKAVLPLRTFIQETLRRSRTSYSTLQVALYYLILIKPHVPRCTLAAELPQGRYTDRALQCGRRMFLAALILASKYLQDRNYSARAWSKISGLNTQEINQNEIAFLICVDWKLHITDEVFRRWTEIVLKHTPPPTPPSPGNAPVVMLQQASDWRRVILELHPDLTNIEALIPPRQKLNSDLCFSSPRSILNLPQEAGVSPSRESAERTRMPALASSYGPPPAVPLEPTPSTVYMTTPGRFAPTLGLLPTPRLTPQTSSFCAPAASATSATSASTQTIGKSNAMATAMAQANYFHMMQHLDRHPAFSVTSSPQPFQTTRRSSLANSISTVSSPESMMSDSSRASRSSSISSASSLACATLNPKLMAPSRYRGAKSLIERVNERASLKAMIRSVLEVEDEDECCLTASPEPYTGPVTKFQNMGLDTPLARQQRILDEMLIPADLSDAARTLQQFRDFPRLAMELTPTPSKAGLKRNRTLSMENSLQDTVREMLLASPSTSAVPSQDKESNTNGSNVYAPMHAPHKRLCCSAEAVSGYQAVSSSPMISFHGSTMWDGILN